MDASTALRRASNLVAALAALSPADMALPVVCKRADCLDPFYPDSVDVRVGRYLEDDGSALGWGFMTDSRFQAWVDESEGRVLNWKWGTDAQRVVLVTLPSAE